MKHLEYFEGKVQSLSLTGKFGNAVHSPVVVAENLCHAPSAGSAYPAAAK